MKKRILVAETILGVSGLFLLFASQSTSADARVLSGDDSYTVARGTTVSDDENAITIKTPDNISLTIDPSAVVTSGDDAIHAKSASTGTISITNSGSIESTVDGQAIDLNNVVGTVNATTITNNAGGIIKADNADSIRPGTNATIVNMGTIYSDGSAGESHDGVDFQEASTGSVINQSGGLISGQRHGITTDGYVDVYNAAGATIIGRNGSGVGSDGTGKVVNYGQITGAYDGSQYGDGDGVDIDGKAYVDNFGVISATGASVTDKNGYSNISEGLALTGGGTVINEKGALITSVQNGVDLCCSNASFTFQNYGTVHGDVAGVGLGGDVTLTNYGDINSNNSAVWVNPDLVSNINIYNYGSISGSIASIRVETGAEASLYIENGSTLSGALVDNGILKLVAVSDATMDSQIIGSGVLNKSGSQDLVLTGDSSGTFTGGTNVLAGILRVDGSIASSDVSVSSGAGIDGKGDIGNLTVQGNATLGGSLRINGSLTQKSGSVLQASGGLITVTGKASIASGSILEASYDGAAVRTAALSGQDQYSVLRAEGGVTGSYTLANNVQVSAFDSLVDAYDDNNVYLRVEQTRSFRDAAVTRNETAAAGALDSAPDNAISKILGLAETDGQARHAFNAVSGEVHASARTEMIQDSLYVRDAAIDRLRNASCAAGAPPQASASWRPPKTPWFERTDMILFNSVI